MNMKIFGVGVLIVIINAVLACYTDSMGIMLFLSLTSTVALIQLIVFLLQKPLFEMRDKLEKAEEENRVLEKMRGEFVANVTHELKTPLTSISGFIETLQAGAINDPEISGRFIDIIAIETERLKRLIDDILTLSDIENRNQVNKTRINVKNSVESTISFLKPIADERKIVLISEVAEDMVIEGDEDRFRQMLFNLTENAIKYSNESERVWITGKTKEDCNIISVKDEGIGIPAEHLDRLFERFYRVDKSRSRKVGGTGLGLSIVKHIAVLFGAKLEVESEVGKGSEFRVIFKNCHK